MSHYKLLEIDRNASNDDIRAAYKDRVLQAHPDKGGSAQMFKRLQDAYEVLRDPVKRKEYDLKLKSLAAAKRFASSASYPTPLSAVKSPSSFALLNGDMYTFETAADKMKTRFRAGDYVANQKEESGCIVGLASNGVYWRKDGDNFASLLFTPGGFCGDDGIHLIFKNNGASLNGTVSGNSTARGSSAHPPTPGRTPRSTQKMPTDSSAATPPATARTEAAAPPTAAPTATHQLTSATPTASVRTSFSSRTAAAASSSSTTAEKAPPQHATPARTSSRVPPPPSSSRTPSSAKAAPSDSTTASRRLNVSSTSPRVASRGSHVDPTPQKRSASKEPPPSSIPSARSASSTISAQAMERRETLRLARITRIASAIKALQALEDDKRTEINRDVDAHFLQFFNGIATWRLKPQSANPRVLIPFSSNLKCFISVDTLSSKGPSSSLAPSSKSHSRAPSASASASGGGAGAHTDHKHAASMAPSRLLAPTASSTSRALSANSHHRVSTASRTPSSNAAHASSISSGAATSSHSHSHSAAAVVTAGPRVGTASPTTSSRIPLHARTAAKPTTTSSTSVIAAVHSTTATARRSRSTESSSNVIGLSSSRLHASSSSTSSANHGFTQKRTASQESRASSRERSTEVINCSTSSGTIIPNARTLWTASKYTSPSRQSAQRQGSPENKQAPLRRSVGHSDSSVSTTSSSPAKLSVATATRATTAIAKGRTISPAGVTRKPPPPAAATVVEVYHHDPMASTVGSNADSTGVVRSYSIGRNMGRIGTLPPKTVVANSSVPTSETRKKSVEKVDETSNETSSSPRPPMVNIGLSESLPFAQSEPPKVNRLSFASSTPTKAKRSSGDQTATAADVGRASFSSSTPSPQEKDLAEMNFVRRTPQVAFDTDGDKTPTTVGMSENQPVSCSAEDHCGPAAAAPLPPTVPSAVDEKELDDITEEDLLAIYLNKNSDENASGTSAVRSLAALPADDDDDEEVSEQAAQPSTAPSSANALLSKPFGSLRFDTSAQKPTTDAGAGARGYRSVTLPSRQAPAQEGERSEQAPPAPKFAIPPPKFVSRRVSNSTQ